jgi:hypothetical protein
VPEAVETLHCPACLRELPDRGETHCPACRAPVTGRARPLALLERELQARIEAKTATRYRQRRRAAKYARRIAALPPTLLQHDAVGYMEDERSTATLTQASPTIVDLPATSVLRVRSTSVLVEEPEGPIAVEERAPRNRPRRRAGAAARRCAPDPIPESVAIDEPVPVDENVTPEPEVDVEPQARLASITRIGPQGTNPVWRDRVFNSARRQPETVSWPRPRPSVSDRPAERAADRFGGAAG